MTDEEREKIEEYRRLIAKARASNQIGAKLLWEKKLKDFLKTVKGLD